MRERRLPSPPGHAGGAHYRSLGTCPACGKQVYPTRKEARQAARQLHPNEHLAAYRCDLPDGSGFHFGHPDQAFRERLGRDRARAAAERAARDGGAA